MKRVSGYRMAVATASETSVVGHSRRSPSVLATPRKSGVAQCFPIIAIANQEARPAHEVAHGSGFYLGRCSSVARSHVGLPLTLALARVQNPVRARTGTQDVNTGLPYISQYQKKKRKKKKRERPLLYIDISTAVSLIRKIMTLVQDKAISTSEPLNSIPPLTTQILTSAPDIVSAVKLITDSIAQQRQIAANAVIFHPSVICVYVLILAVIHQAVYNNSGDIPLLVTTCAGVTMSLLVAVRAWVSGYIAHAEELSSTLVRDGDGKCDIIFVGSRYGETLIGALILEIERTAPNAGRGVITAWTTKQKYRGVGIGTGLLEEAVRITRSTLGDAPEIIFSPEHANSKMVLPEMFNKRFEQREDRARKALESIMAH